MRGFPALASRKVCRPTCAGEGRQDLTIGEVIICWRIDRVRWRQIAVGACVGKEVAG